MTHDPREALEPCPFCGGEALMLKDHKRLGVYVGCTICHACGPTGLKPEVLKQWNARALTASAPKGEPDDLTWFWEIVDSEGFEGVPSDERDALSRIMNELRRLRTSPPQAAGWNEAIEAAMAAIESMRVKGAANFVDARHQGQRGCDYTDTLYDAYQAVKALRRESPAPSGVVCANCKDPLGTFDAPLFCGCCRELGAARPAAGGGVREAVDKSALEEQARELLAKEYDVGSGDGPYPTYAAIARDTKHTGAFTMCSIRAIMAALSNPPAAVEKEADDWRDDPSADERWNAGLDFAMGQFCAALGVDPKSVRWDAATETLDGDVNSVIWNILRARFGEDWDPAAVESNGRREAETGWLVEVSDTPVYAVLTADHDENWTHDAGKAIRFARREDAQAYSDHIGWTSPPVRIVEHMWPAAVESNASAGLSEFARDLAAEQEPLGQQFQLTSEEMSALYPLRTDGSVNESAEARLREALACLIEYVERNECTHESTHRGGTIWTICDECDRKWSDDRDPFSPYEEPAALKQAKAALSAVGDEAKKSEGGKHSPAKDEYLDGIMEKAKISPLIEYGTGWAKIHFKRELTDQDRDNIVRALKTPSDPPDWREIVARIRDEVIEECAKLADTHKGYPTPVSEKIRSLKTGSEK